MNLNIKAVVLDVDGILVGNKGGVNFPASSAEIIKALKTINGNGIPVILCTGRPFYTPAMGSIIKSAELDNYHIGNMGGLIMNPINKRILDAKIIDKKTSFLIARTLLDSNIYVNIITPENYFVQKNQIDSEITNVISEAIAAKPSVVDSLMEVAIVADVLYYLAIAKDEQGKLKIGEVASQYPDKLDLLWGNNPSSPLLHLGNLVPAGISKALSLKKLLDYLNIPFENVLGAGDGIVDWDFMKLCGYCSTLENAMLEVKQNVAAINDPQRAFIGPHVDSNGLLEVFKHFKLI